MKCVVDREALFTAFQTVAAVVPSRTTKPILRNVRLDMTAAGGGVLTATDLEVGVRFQVPVDVHEDGSFLAPVNLLGAILRESPDDQLTLATVKAGTVISGKFSEFKLPYQNPDEFPVVEPFGEDKYHVLNGSVLAKLIRQTVFATDAQNARYALGGVLLQLSEQAIAVATDGRRLAKASGEILSREGVQGAASAVVPTRAVQLLEKSVPGTDRVRVAMRHNDIVIGTSTATITARLLEGRFPSWESVIPTGQRYTVTVPVSELHAALRQASICTNAESRGVGFHFSNGTLQLQASASESGNARVDLPISYTGEAVAMELDYRYVGDCLRTLPAESVVQIQFDSPDSPVLFSADSYQYVVMPMAKRT